MSVNWEKVNYLLDEIKEWGEDDTIYVRNCCEELALNHLPTLIKHIQKLAKEKNEYKKKYENYINFFSPTSGGINVRPGKYQIWNWPEVHHSILYNYSEPGFVKFTPKYQDLTHPPYNSAIWFNSTLRDSL